MGLLAGARKPKGNLLPIPRSFHGIAFPLPVSGITSILYNEGTEKLNDEQYDRLQRGLSTVNVLMNKSNKRNDGRDATNNRMESITNAFLHFCKVG